MTVAELLEEWMQNEQRERIKTQTYARYKGLIELHILPVFGSRPIEAVTRRQISDFMAGKRREGNTRYGGGLSPVSINLMLSILHMAFAYAYDQEMLNGNPCEGVKRVPTAVQRKIDAFTKCEQKQLEQAMAEEGDTRLFGILLCFYTGLRIGELLALEWSDTDDECRILTVTKTVYRSRDETGEWQLFVDRPKTLASQRCIPLPEHITKELLARKKQSLSPYIVCNKKNERMSIRSYQYMFEQLTRKAHVRRLSFHAIRHTFATRALENGADIKTLSEIMGHTNTSITLNRYVHCMLESKIEMMKKMTRVM